MISREFHKDRLGTKVNMVILNPHVLRNVEKDVKGIPLIQWKLLIDEAVCKNEGYREDLALEVLLPLEIAGHWILVIWNFETRERATVAFNDIEIGEDDWAVVQLLDQTVEETVVRMIAKGDKKVQRRDPDAKGPWKSADEFEEAWTDVGRMSYVRDHERLMALLSALATESRRSLEALWNVQMRDINDSAVLRRVRMMQLATLTFDREGMLNLKRVSPRKRKERK